MTQLMDPVLKEEVKVSDKRPVWLAGLFFIALGLIYFFPVLQGKVLSSSDWMYTVLPWSAHPSEGFAGASNKDLNDDPLQFLPWAHFYVSNLKKGIFPLWDPQSYCGAPFLGYYQNAVFFPFKLFFLVLPFASAYTLQILLKPVLAGFFMFLFLRSSRLSPLSSLFGGIAYAFCGPMAVWMLHPHTQVFLLIPAVSWATNLLIKERSLRMSALLAFLLGVQYLGGHPESSFHLVVFNGLYFCYGLFEAGRRKACLSPILKITGFFVLAHWAAVMLASIQWMPFLEYISNSRAMQVRSGQAYEIPLGLMTSLSLLIPKFFGSPVDVNYPYVLTKTNFVDQCGYAGIVTLVLAVFALVKEWKNHAVRFFSVLGTLCLAVAYGSPIFYFLARFPGFSSTNSKRFMIVYVFSMIVLACIGLESLRRTREPEKEKRGTEFVLGLTGILLLAGVAGSLFLWKQYPQLWSLYSLKQVAFFLLFGGLSLALLLIGKRSLQFGVCWITAAIVLLIADLFLFGMGFVPFMEKKDLNFPAAAGQFLQADQSVHRVFALGNVYPPNTAMLHDLEDARGFDAIIPGRYYQLQQLLGSITERKDIHIENLHRPWILNFMNVKYLMMNPDVEASGIPDPSQFKLVYDKEIRIFENLQMLPRAFFVKEAVSVSDEEALKMIAEPGFDFSSKVMLPQGTDLAGKRNQSTENVRAALTRINELSPNHVEIKAETDENRWLVISDSYYPGWRAFSNGKEIPVYRANYAFRALYLEKGQHDIHFYFRSRPFHLGLSLSLGTLALLILAGLKKPSRSQPSFEPVFWDASL